jgi:hypothetical protein
MAVPKHLLLTDSKEANEARASERQKLGLGKDYKLLRSALLKYRDGMAGDPNYYAAELGSTEVSWEEL